MSRSRQLAAIMFTDIKGYTALMQQNEDKAIQARAKHRQIFNTTTEKYKGKILQYYGDGTLSIFDSAIDAVKCGIEMQLGFQKAPPIPVRIGIHTGDIFFSEEEIVGDSVNVASRIESLAVPGSVFISDKVYDEIKNQSSIQTTLIKTFQLKNIERPIEVYAIANEGLVVPDPEIVKGKTEKGSTSPTPTTTLQVLATKLFIPPPRPNAVRRQRLLDKVNAGLSGKLTLVSAPAGFGKTTLVSEWIAGTDRPVAWLSLEERDSELIRFMTYFVAALQKIDANLGQGVSALLQSPQPPAADSLMAHLVNEIASFPQPFVIVLDDYHLIDDQSVNQALLFLLENLPPQMHLIFTTREDPPFPLARFRVRGQLTEIRVADLRFTPEEAVDFLNQGMGLNLSAKEVEALESRTEGWIAGLQMAALSLQGQSNKEDFIEAFTGSHHFVLDYLVEEVLQQQPKNIREFLLRTSILDRLSGGLCNAVTQKQNGKELLETLERENLFVIPLDNSRQWYRYHHLFAEVLRVRALKEEGDKIPTYHLRASEWYQKEGDLPEAIQHAFAAEDFIRSAELIERVWPEMDGSFQTETWLSWFDMLPREIIQNRPVLLVGAGWSYLNDGEMEAGEPYFQMAERILQKDVVDQVMVDEEQLKYLPASIATARAYSAQSKGDFPTTIQQAKKALDLLPAEDHLRRGPAAALLGLTYWGNGELEEAYQAINEAMVNFRNVGQVNFAISGTFGMADIRLSQGRLREAVKVYERSFKMVNEMEEDFPVGTADLYLGLGDLHRESGDLEKARELLNKSEELGPQLALPDWKCRFCIAQAKLKEAEGEPEIALKLLDEAEAYYKLSPVPNVRPIPARNVKLWIHLGLFTEAHTWAQNVQVSAIDKPHFLKSFEQLTLARVLLADYLQNKQPDTIEKALSLLDRLLEAANKGGQKGHSLEILIQMALAQLAQKNNKKALESLEQALGLASSEGYARVFLDEGERMIQLLKLAVKNNVHPHYANKLLSLANLEEEVKKAPSNQPLVEPLSDRELEILQLIAQGLSNQEICSRLFLALSTVKGHNRNIFGKLGVQRRTEAVARARQLGMI